ncbi:MAG: glycosyltransferase family 2 protein [Treponemataceae bacterium]
MQKLKRLFCFTKGIFISAIKNGLRKTARRVQKTYQRKKEAKRVITFDSLKLTKIEKEEQEKHIFAKKITFSILTPLYNTDKHMLKEMIESVQSQTYKNWQLCLADGSDEKHPYVGDIVQQYAQNDKRIAYKKLKKNLGISGNTNECIKIAKGEYLSLLDHDDILHEAALFETMKAIEEKHADFIYTDEVVFNATVDNLDYFHFKTDYAPDTLRSVNFICHFSSFSAQLLAEVGNFRSECDGSQDYDTSLRLTEKATKIVHISKTLYFWRAHTKSIAKNLSAKNYVTPAAKKALEYHLQRIELQGVVADAIMPATYKIDYIIEKNPRVTIIIPNKDHVAELQKCLDSIINKTSYQNYEIVIVENNSTKRKTFDFYKGLQKNKRIQVMTYTDNFNYSKINNFAIDRINTDYVIFLHNDTEIISPDWIEQMLMYCQRKDVGCVGAKLYYPDDTIQHAGIILGLQGSAWYSHKDFKRNDNGYAYRLSYTQNLSAVSAACMMIKPSVFNEVNGFDEKLAVSLNDVDLCMKVRSKGYLIVWTPHCELYHSEGRSTGRRYIFKNKKRLIDEHAYFTKKWQKELEAGDPYYNPNLTVKRDDFSLKV